MQADTLDGGFADPATDAAHAFRAVMEARKRKPRREVVSKRYLQKRQTQQHQ